MLEFTFDRSEIKAATNKGLAQWRVKCKNEVSAFYSAKSQLD